MAVTTRGSSSLSSCARALVLLAALLGCGPRAAPQHLAGDPAPITRKDGSRAEAHVQLASTAADPDGPAGGQAQAALVDPPRWVLTLVRTKDSVWHIKAAVPK